MIIFTQANPDIQFNQKKNEQSFCLSTEIANLSRNLSNPFDLIKVKCLGKNIAINFCTFKQCQSQNIFCCSNLQCQCNKKHFKCQFSKLMYPFSNIMNKIQLMENVLVCVENAFFDIKNIIDNQKEKILKEFFENYLTSEEKKFLNVVKAKLEVSCIDSSFAYKIFEGCGIQDQKTDKLENLQKQMLRFYSKIENEINILQQRLQLVAENKLLEQDKGNELKNTFTPHETGFNPEKQDSLDYKQQLADYQQLKTVHSQLFAAIKKIKGQIQYGGNYLNPYDSSSQYFHIDPRRNCISVYQQLDRLDLDQFEFNTDQKIPKVVE